MQPHPALAHSDLGCALLMIAHELRRGNLPRARGWADAVIPPACDLASLAPCKRCKGIEPHPADAHENAMILLHIIKREVAAGRVQSALMWIGSSRKLVKLCPPPLSVRIVQTPERTLYLYQGGM